MQIETRCAIIQFLREWLPPRVRSTYRQMMVDDPGGWHLDPHFAGGIILRHALRGNGINVPLTAGVDLDAEWPELLRAAVLESTDTRQTTADRE